MKKILFLALLGCNFANAQFKMSVHANPNITKPYGGVFEMRDISGNTVPSGIKSGYGYDIGASLIYEVNNSIDVSVNIDHSQKKYSQNLLTFNPSTMPLSTVEYSFTQFTPSLNARYKHKFFYVSAGVGYGMTSNNYYNSQNTINLKASIGHQIKITEKSKINVFLSDEYMTKGYNTFMNNSSFNTIGLGIGFETSL